MDPDWDPASEKLDPDMCIYMHRAYTRTKLSQEKSEKLSELERKRAGAEGASCTRAHTHTHSRNNTHAQRKIE